VLRGDCDERGWPAAPDETPTATPDDAMTTSTPTAVPDTTAITAPGGSAGTAPEPAAPATGLPSPALALALPAVHGFTATTGAALLPDGTDLLGRTIDDYIDKLIELYRPVWEQQGDEGRGVRWWVGQLQFVKAVLRYDDGDERIGYCGIAAGDSLHFAQLGQRDFNRALRLRRAVNLRVAHQNG
jgi:hypothetical protein